MVAIITEIVEVDSDVTGLLWSVGDLDDLAKIISVITLGQSEHAARIIHSLEPHGPALSDAQLYQGARNQLRILGISDEQKEVSRYHRDGFLFECISWIEAQQAAGERTFLKDPHLTSTTQGLDGLMIQMHPTKNDVERATIFEDKCTDSPRKKFREEVIPAFTDHHHSKRSRELVANAVSLIKESGLNGTQAVHAAARVLDVSYRAYRAALTTDASINSVLKRKGLFKGYNCLAGIQKSQRLGAIFLIDGDLREWFQSLAELAIQKLDEFEAANV